jgi:hypothetical protein
MFVACRLAGLSALEAHYAGLIALTQSGAMTADPLPDDSLRIVSKGGKTKPQGRVVIRISFTSTAFDSIASTLPLGSIGFVSEAEAKGERLVWLPPTVVNRLKALRGPSESYSDVILRDVVGAREKSLSRLNGWPMLPRLHRRPHGRQRMAGP